MRRTASASEGLAVGALRIGIVLVCGRILSSLGSFGGRLGRRCLSLIIIGGSFARLCARLVWPVSIRII
jgi:hypothetical protein